MTPKNTIAALLNLARAAANLSTGYRPNASEHVSVRGEDMSALYDALDKLKVPDGEGDPIELAAASLVTLDYSPNTIYLTATDIDAKPVSVGVRSTSLPRQDVTIMESALDFEQAKRLRGQEIQPFKVGNLWMTTIEPITISHDFYTHRDSWREAIKGCGEDALSPDEKSYWEHELQAFDRTFATLPAELPKYARIVIPETVRDAVLAETYIGAQKVVNDAELLDGLRLMCGYVENGSQEPVTIGQDDATRDWYLRVGYNGTGMKSRSYSASSFHQVIRVATEKEIPDEEPEPTMCEFCGMSFVSPCEAPPTGPCEQANNAFHGSDPTKPRITLDVRPMEVQLEHAAKVVTSAQREQMNALLLEVKDKLGVAAAKSIIKNTGKSPHLMVDIADENIDAVIAMCQSELAAERDHEAGQ